MTKKITGCAVSFCKLPAPSKLKCRCFKIFTLAAADRESEDFSHFYQALVSFVSLQVSQVINSSFGYSFQIQALGKNVSASLSTCTYNRYLLKRPKFQRIAFKVRM